MSKINFYVNPEKRQVICKIVDAKYDFINFFLGHNDQAIDSFYYQTPLFIKLKMPNVFIGVATCAEQDVFNEEIGRKIALTRAREKRDKSFFKRANLFFSVADRHLNEFEDAINRYGERIARHAQEQEETINSMIGDNNENT